MRACPGEIVIGDVDRFGKRSASEFQAKETDSSALVARGTLTAGTPTVSGSAAKAIRGATKSTYTLSSGTKGKSIAVKVTGRKSGYATFAKTSKATAKVVAPKPAAKPSGRAKPISVSRCPSSHPIKGNQTTRHTSDWIDHVPGGQYYAATHPRSASQPLGTPSGRATARPSADGA